MNGGQISQKRVRFKEDEVEPPNRKRLPFPSETKGLRKIITAQCPNGQYVKMLVRRTELEQNKYLVKMRKGAIFYKFNRTGVAEERWFIVSEDGCNLTWTKPKRGFLGMKSQKTKNIADALYLTYGNSESQKPQQRFEIPTWLCFTIVFCEKIGTTSKSWVTREVSVACKDLEQFETWFFGIQSLIPLHHQHKSQAYILWERAMMKLESIAARQSTNPSKVWQSLFENAIRHVKGSSHKFMLRKLVHMNLSRLARQAREAEVKNAENSDASPPPVKGKQAIPEKPPSPSLEKKLMGRRKPGSLRDLYQESSPKTSHRRIATHDLTERMISRRTPYVEKKVGHTKFMNKANSDRSLPSIDSLAINKEKNRNM